MRRNTLREQRPKSPHSEESAPRTRMHDLLIIHRIAPRQSKLHSTKFNQSFSADGAVCSLKEDKEGRFYLRIDGVLHHSWFRRKKDEFMEALGLPTSRRQNRGLKL